MAVPSIMSCKFLDISLISINQEIFRYFLWYVPRCPMEIFKLILWGMLVGHSDISFIIIMSSYRIPLWLCCAKSTSLAHWGLIKVAVFCKWLISDAFSWMKIYKNWWPCPTCIYSIWIINSFMLCRVMLQGSSLSIFSSSNRKIFGVTFNLDSHSFHGGA